MCVRIQLCMLHAFYVVLRISRLKIYSQFSLTFHTVSL